MLPNPSGSTEIRPRSRPSRSISERSDSPAVEHLPHWDTRLEPQTHDLRVVVDGRDDVGEGRDGSAIGLQLRRPWPMMLR